MIARSLIILNEQTPVKLFFVRDAPKAVLRENALTSEAIGRNMNASGDNDVSRAFVPVRRCLLFYPLRQEVPYGRI